MAVYDNNGTANAEIGKLYDDDGTTNYQIGKVYDNNGTTDSLIYQNEEILYNAGNECTAITGGWSGAATTGGSFHTGTISAGKGSSSLNITFSQDNDNICYTFYTNNTVNLTGYDKLCFQVTTTSSNKVGSFVGGASTAKSNGMYENQGHYKATVGSPASSSYSGVLTANISGLSGAYYIVCRLNTWSSYGMQSQSVKIHKVWIE